MRASLCTIALLVTAMSACSKPDTGATPALDTTAASDAGVRGIHPAWSKDAVMYEVNIRQYTPEGTFAAFTRHLPRLKALGVDILWIMPVQPIGKVNRKGTLGSYYSIADYTAINPEFGTEADFKAMVAAAHDLGFKVILDWVANHTAFDHHWTTEHPDWYTRRPDGTISRAIDDKGKETDWSDVADLNYGNAAMRAAMIGEMRWWLDSTGIDGFRCDIAGFVPTDFWAEVRTALNVGRRPLFFLAEWEDPALHASFDATYGWGLFHLLNDVASAKQTTPALDKYFLESEARFPDDGYRLNFTSNHDENSWNGTEFERMGANHQAAFVLSATAQRSMPLLYSGQEANLQRRLPFFEKDSISWADTTLTPFYRAVFDLRHTQEVLWNGPWGAPQTIIATNGGDRVWAFVRARGDKAVLVVTNFGDAPASVTLTAFAHPGSYTDWFSKAAVPLTADATVEVPAHGFRVLVR
jgi:alpha-amylase